MSGTCNEDLIRQARLNVSERYVQTYHVNAILSGDWDRGTIIKNEMENLLKNPPPVEDVE
jgi:hypothetical protein